MILFYLPLNIGSHNKLNWDKAFGEPGVNYGRGRFEVAASALGADFI
jgi:hypothetical protein